ncbi:copper resistance protein B [Parahaliea mediterranea]|uniref:copper resistance protein B n=1 Tax=Parahaliea mediterranea TaxID=651086 RepID=UPI001F4D8248|nr:copper resistance protein B [Parahaliea mediterranea]|tara:strand:+ start:7254 stop:8225 length:972 start_codon:yes stop_codon:yes gene_type:complete
MNKLHRYGFFTRSAVLGMLTLASLPVWAQSDDPHSGHGSSSTAAREAPEQVKAVPSSQQAQATSSSSSSMNSADMNMQGGEAPTDARDPHAYSDGYTLTDGPYTLFSQRQLTLADEHRFRALLADRLEYDAGSETGVFDIQGWYGTTFNRLVVKLEGDVADGRLEESQTDVLWSRALNGYFDTQLGIRMDQYDEGRDRQWLAFGLQGLAPYWFELDMTAYLGESGRTALTLEAEYELLLTQRLILQPRAELTLYGKDDVDNDLGSGISDSALGLRLRYEFSRQFAPYVGIEWTNKYGNTADFARAANTPVRDTLYVVGVRLWF